MSEIVEQAKHELADVKMNTGFMIFDNLDNALKCAEIIAKSGICPKDYKDKPTDVLVAVQFGMEVGLTPMQALQNVAVINGRPTLWGDAMLALCVSKSDYEWHDEGFDEKSQKGWCYVKVKSRQELYREFSVEDAKIAGLYNKVGPWKTYPKRMCMLRARGFALRDAFPHHLKGLKIAEEVKDEHYHKEQEVRGRRIVEAEPYTVDESDKIKLELIEDIKLMIPKKNAADYVKKCLDAADATHLGELDEGKLEAILCALVRKKDVSQAESLASQLKA